MFNPNFFLKMAPKYLKMFLKCQKNALKNYEKSSGPGGPTANSEWAGPRLFFEWAGPARSRKKNRPGREKNGPCYPITVSTPITRHDEVRKTTETEVSKGSPKINNQTGNRNFWFDARMKNDDKTKHWSTLKHLWKRPFGNEHKHQTRKSK